jgi:hypothetical protein
LCKIVYLCETQTHTMKVAIINRQIKIGTLDGVIMLNSEIMKLVYSALKQGLAKLVVDNEETLMYELGA